MSESNNFENTSTIELDSFIGHMKLVASDGFDVDSASYQNPKIIDFVDSFFKNNSDAINKHNENAPKHHGFFHRTQISEHLDWIYKHPAYPRPEKPLLFDISCEIPLAFIVAGGFLIEALQLIIITNKNIHYYLVLSKEAKDIKFASRGSIPLADIKRIMTEPQKLFTRAVTGCRVNLTINNEMIGSFYDHHCLENLVNVFFNDLISHREVLFSSESNKPNPNIEINESDDKLNKNNNINDDRGKISGDIPIKSSNNSERLQKEVLKLTNEGYHVVFQNENSAQLKKDKKFSIGWAIIWAIITFFIGGIGFIFYIGYYFLIKKDEYKHINANLSDVAMDKVVEKS